MEETKQIINEIVKQLDKNKKLDHFSRITLLNNLYNLMNDMFNDEKTAEEDKRKLCAFAIKFLIPYSNKFTTKALNEEQWKEMNEYYYVWKKAYAFAARRSLEHFIEYMELDMAKNVRVYGNRREVLKPLVYYLNKITFDDNMEFLEASYPPSYGKTYILNLYSAWVFGLDKENSILRISYSEELVLAASRSIQNYIKSPKYAEIFEYYSSFNGKCFDKEKESDWTIRGSSTQTSHIARTRDGSVTGVRANKAIIIDDILKGAEEAINTSNHNKIYNSWKTEWVNRKANDNCKYIFVGTMWSNEDLLNRVISDFESGTRYIPCPIREFNKTVMLTENGKAVVIRMPLLDENNKSTCEKITSTEKALALRDTTEPFLFSCVYQQNPIAPTGLEFADSELEHYDMLPLYENGDKAYSEYAFAVLDPARKGKDNVSMPICVVDNSDETYYMVDCLFKQKAMTELYDDIVDKIIQHHVIKFVVENNIDTSLKVLLQEKLEAKGYHDCEIIEKFNTAPKEKRIKDMRGIIKRRVAFKEKQAYKPNTDYGRFMQNFTTYSFDYANKHDDAPDSLALFANEIILGNARVSAPKGILRSLLGI